MLFSFPRYVVRNTLYEYFSIRIFLVFQCQRVYVFLDKARLAPHPCSTPQQETGSAARQAESLALPATCQPETLRRGRELTWRGNPILS